MGPNTSPTNAMIFHTVYSMLVLMSDQSGLATHVLNKLIIIGCQLEMLVLVFLGEILLDAASKHHSPCLSPHTS